MKCYELVAHVCEDGRIGILRRWGRVGAPMCELVEIVEASKAARVLAGYERKRARRGYVLESEAREGAIVRSLRWLAPSRPSTVVDARQGVLFSA